MTDKPTITFTLDRSEKLVRARRRGVSGTFSVIGLLKLWGFIDDGEDVEIVIEVVPGAGEERA